MLNTNDGHTRNRLPLNKNFVDHSEKSCESGTNMIVMIFFFWKFFSMKTKTQGTEAVKLSNKYSYRKHTRKDQCYNYVLHMYVLNLFS